MNLFGSELNNVERRMLKNSTNTKAVFPEETQLIEVGLALLWNLTQVTNNAKKDFATKPNLFANTNLFGRNRQLLLNAYFCMLCSNYGTQFVISRTVLENNNLMRLFNMNPRYAFEWLPQNKQKEFSPETQLKYSGSDEKKTFDPFWVLKEVLGEEKQKTAKKDTARIYGQLCDYTHPNFSGWQEIMGIQGANEILLDLPTWSSENTENAVIMTLFLIQLSFKTFVETFKGYWLSYAAQIYEWQKEFDKLIVKYIK
jgi:hypothetical protein